MPFRATNVLLTDTEARVLGCLVEKEITTPDYYPLSLNALINACNQKSNRDPVMSLNEEAVRQALHSLNEKGLAGTGSSAGDSRVAKYEHRMQEGFNFTRRETAIMCVLMLRGPQTPGELRGRSERLGVALIFRRVQVHSGHRVDPTQMIMNFSHSRDVLCGDDRCLPRTFFGDDAGKMHDSVAHDNR